MKSLNLKNKLVLFFFFFLAGCAILPKPSLSYFQLKRELNGVVEVVMTPDRILVECVKSDEDPDEGRYGFLIRMLDEEKTVTTSMLSIRPDKYNCERRIQKTKRILKKAKNVYIGSWGRLSSDPRIINRELSFMLNGQGPFYDNGRALQLGVIVNDRGECFNPLASDKEPCLEYPFPIEKHEKKLLDH